ncbi:MAG: LON peptidase substrate-binding domain-containing protein [Capsulimonadaceae bacterium]|nr:LON peptidase substrate-binding domain-containing protein [Capsulimonadaceae bacterium]
MLDLERVPIFPLQAVLFPGTSIPLNIFEARYTQMVEECLAANSPFGVVLIVEGTDVDDGSGPPVISSVGCLARISRSDKLDDGRYYIEATGSTRFILEETSTGSPYLTGRITPIEEEAGDPVQIDNLCRGIRGQFRKYIVKLFKKLNRTVSTIQLPEDPTSLSFAVAGAMEISLAEKQKLLEMRRTDERLARVSELLRSQPDPVATPIIEGEQGGDPQGPTIKRVSAKTLRSLVSRN